ncbi:MAG: hypothetical protein ABUT20_20385 [Bacteroidota bacterium]
MKKLLMVLAIAGFAVACNNDSDTPAATTDTPAATAPVATPDTSAMAAPDTTHKDTTKM